MLVRCPHSVLPSRLGRRRQRPQSWEERRCGSSCLSNRSRQARVAHASGRKCQRLSHVRMFEHSGKLNAVLGSSPVENRLEDQQMKQGVVSGGYRAAQAGLLGAFGLAPDQVPTLLKQAFGQSHALSPAPAAGRFPESLRLSFRSFGKGGLVCWRGRRAGRERRLPRNQWSRASTRTGFSRHREPMQRQPSGWLLRAGAG